MAITKGSVKKSSPSQLSWFKNAAKSLGYTSTELITTLAPSMGEFITENKDYAKELATDLRGMKDKNKQFSGLFNASAQMGIAKEALKNALDDIKTGKIYNRERQDSLYDDDFDMGDDGFGMDDFSFEGGEVSLDLNNDGKSDSSTVVPNINIRNVQPPMTRNNPMVKAVQQQSEITIRAAQANQDTQTSIAANQAMLSRKIGASTIAGVQSINDNLSLLVNFHSDSMSKYIGASLKYYEDSLQTLNNTLAEIKRTNGTGEQVEQERKKDPTEDLFLVNGGLNLKGYMANIKKNVSKEFSENMFLAPIKMMFEDTDTLKMLAASPLSFISTKIVTTLIPQMLQSSIQNLDKSFSAFFPALLMKVNRMAQSTNNPFIELLGNIFGATVRSKSTVDLSKYNRGQVPFDGETKKAIVEVIPTYLRKILAAVSGQEEVAYDYSKGTFSSVSSMKKQFESDRDNRILSAFGSSVDQIKERSQAFEFNSVNERKKFDDGIQSFFKELAKQNHLVNPKLTKDKDGNVRDELSEVHNFEGDKGMQKLFRQLILTMPKNEQMKMFGKDVIEARRNNLRFMESIEENPLNHNASVLFNGLGDTNNLDKHLNPKKEGQARTVKSGWGLFNPTDKYGSSSLDYLRGIKTILMQGIRVFPEGGMGGSGGSTILGPDGNPMSNPGNSILQSYQNQIAAMRTKAQTIQQAEQNQTAKENRTLNLTPQEELKRQERGQTVVNTSLDIANMSTQDINQQIKSREIYKNQNPEQNNQKQSITQWIGKFFKGDTQEKYNLLREKMDSLLKKPADLLKSVFDKIDNTMYDIIFGKDGDDGSKSFFSKTLEKLGDKFESMGIWIKTKVFEPIKDALIGENGLITKMQNSEFFKSLKKNMSKFGEWMFGKKGKDGTRRDGLLADTGNNILDMWDGAKYYFTGKGYVNRAGQKFDDNDDSVLNQARKVFKDFGGHLKKYLIGDKKADDEDNKRGVLTGIIGGLKEGFVNFKDAIFGPSGMTQKKKETTFKDLAESVKKRAPKALAWGVVGGGLGTAAAMSGGLGLLGSIFLPGGPIGAAVLGTSLGFLTQSDKFMNWAFGEKNAQNERVGGLISKGMQDWVKKNKSFLIGGAAIGAMKPILGMGVLPGLMLPGGPIAGALFGVGTAMLVRSEGFQKFMYGEKDADGKRMGGFLSKSFSKIKGLKNKADGNNLFGNMGAGAIGGAGFAAVIGKMGLLGAMLTPGGLIGGAVLGAATGIAMSSGRWKKALFGTWDEKTGLRDGGLLGKFNNFFKLEVMAPLGNQLKQINLNFSQWFTEKISNPFADAIAPMKQAFTDMTTKLGDFFKDGWDSFKTKIGDVFENNVGKPFGQFMQENVMKPLRGFLMKIVGGIGKIFAPIAEAPVKILSSFAEGFRKKQEQRGLERHVEDGWSDLTDVRGRKERGEKLGLFRKTEKKDANGQTVVDENGNPVMNKSVFGRIHNMYFDKKAREDSKYGPNGASYGREEDEKIKKRNEAQQKKFADQQATIDAERENLDKHRRLGLKYDYNNLMHKPVLGPDGKPKLDAHGNPLTEAINISRIYNVTKSKSAFSHFMKREGESQNYQRNIKDSLGVDLADLLQIKKEDREGFNASMMSKGHRKIVQKALKSGKHGNSLLRMFGIDPDKLEAEKVAETQAKEQAEATKPGALKASVDSMSEHSTEAIKQASPIDAIEKNLVPVVKQTNSMLHEIASMVGKVLGIPSKAFKTKVTGGDVSNFPHLKDKNLKINREQPHLKFKIKSDKDLPSHASGIDNVPYDNYQANLHQGEMVVPAGQANKIREASGQPKEKESKATGPVNASNRIVNNLPSGSVPKDKTSILARIASDVRLVAREVSGQLDGVGSNVYKIRKIIQKTNNITDEDLSGSANRDRVGFMGKMRRLFFKPLDTLRDKLLGAVLKVTDKIRAFGQGIANVTKAIVMVPVNIVKGIGKGISTVVKGVGSMIKSTVIELGKLPGKIIGVVGEGFKAVGHIVKALGPAVSSMLKGAADLIGGAARGLGNALTGIGKGIGGLFKNLGIGIGKTIGALGTTVAKLTSSLGSFLAKATNTVLNLGASILKSTGKMISGSAKMLVDFSLKTVSAIGNTLGTIGKGLLSIISSPIKFLGKGLSKMMGVGEQKVVIVGGHLDSIKTIKTIETVKHINGHFGGSHASGLDNVPHDNYKANLHQGEMVIPASQANKLREASGHPRVKESNVRGPINNSNKLVNNISKPADKVTIEGFASKAIRSMVSAIREAIKPPMMKSMHLNGHDGMGSHEHGEEHLGDQHQGSEPLHGNASQHAAGSILGFASSMIHKGRMAGRIGRGIARSRFGKAIAGSRAGRSISGGLSRIRGAVTGGLKGGMKSAIMGSFQGFLNKRKNNLSLEDKLTKMNIVPGVNGNVIPFPQPGKTSGVLGNIVESVFGTLRLPNALGAGISADHSVNFGKIANGTAGGSHGTIRNADHENAVREEKQERAAVAGFRVANVGILSMIESNTRRAADDLDWIVDWLKKFKFPPQKCCPMIGGGMGGSGGSGGSGGNGGKGGNAVARPVVVPAGAVRPVVVPWGAKVPRAVRVKEPRPVRVREPRPARVKQPRGGLWGMPWLQRNRKQRRNRLPELEPRTAPGQNPIPIPTDDPRDNQQRKPVDVNDPHITKHRTSTEERSKTGNPNQVDETRTGRNQKKGEGKGRRVKDVIGDVNGKIKDKVKGVGGRVKEGVRGWGGRVREGLGNVGRGGLQPNFAMAGAGGPDTHVSSREGGVGSRIANFFRSGNSEGSRMDEWNRQYNQGRNGSSLDDEIRNRNNMIDDIVDNDGRNTRSARTPMRTRIRNVTSRMRMPRLRGPIGAIGNIASRVLGSGVGSRVLGSAGNVLGRAGGSIGRGAGTVAKGAGKGILGVGKGLLKGGKVLGTVAKGAGSLLGSIPFLNAAMGAYNGYDARNRAGDIFGTGEAVTGGQKTAAMLAGGAVGFIPGLSMIDMMTGGKITDVASKLTYGIGSTVGKTKVGQAIGKGAVATWNGMKKLPGMASNAWDATKKGASNLWQGTKDFAGKAKTVASQSIQGMGMMATDAGHAISKGTSNAWKGTKKVAGKVGNFFGGLFGATKAHASDGDLSQDAIDKWKNADNRNIFQKTGSKIANSKVGKAVGSVANKVKNYASDTWNEVKSGDIKGLAKRAFNASPAGLLNNKMGDPLGKAKEGLKNMADGLSKSVDDIKKSTGEAWGKTKDAVGKKWDETKKSFGDSVDSIKKKTSDTWNSSKETAGKAWDNTKDSVSKAVTNIKTKTSDVWNKTKETAGKAWDDSKKSLTEKATKIASDVKSKFESAKTAAGKNWDSAKKNLTEKSTKIASDVKSKFESAKTAAGKNWDSAKKNLTSKASAIASDVKSKFESAKTSAGKNWDSAKKNLTSKASAIASDVKSKFESAKTSASTHWNKAKSNLTTKASEIASDVKSKFSAAKTQASTKLSKMASDVGSKAGDIKSAVTTALSNAASSVASGLSSLAAKAKSIWNSVTGGKGFGKGPGADCDQSGAGKLKAATQNVKKSNPTIMKMVDKDTPNDSVKNESEEFGAGKTKSLNGMTYYSQNDSRWSGKSLTTGKGPSLGAAGCGPTTAAMLLSSVTGEQVTPTDTLKFAQQGGYVDAKRGTRSDFFQGVGAQYGVPILPQGNDANTIKQDLAMKRPVILRGQGGRAFTDGGHYVVATGMDKSGKILVNDPISKNRSRAYNPTELLRNTTSSYVAMPKVGKAKRATKAVRFAKGLAKRYGAGTVGDKMPIDFGKGKASVDDIIKEAKTWLGVKYLFGGTTRSGVDCSGFTQNVFREAANINLPRTAADQSKKGKRLKNSEIRRGDLVFFANTYKPGISHVGIALGDGKFIGANGDSVKVSDYTTGHYKEKFDHGRRYDLEGTGKGGGSGIDDTAGSTTKSGNPLSGFKLSDWLQSKFGETMETIGMNGLTGKKDKVNWTVPTEDGSTTTNPTTGNEQPPAGKVSGTETASKVWNVLAAHKLSSNAIAGILGNLQAESSMDVKKLQAGGKPNTGAGLAQWTIGHRWEGVKKYAASKKISPWSAEAQGEFIWKELNLKGHPWGSPSELNKKSARDAALYFSNKFERPNAKFAHNDNRMNYAEQWYKKLAGGKGFDDNVEYGAGVVKNLVPVDSTTLKLQKMGIAGDGPSEPLITRAVNRIAQSFGKGKGVDCSQDFGMGTILPGLNQSNDDEVEISVEHQGINEATQAAVDNIKNRMARPATRVSETRAPESFGMGITDSYMTQQQTSAAVSNSNDSILKQAVDLLKQISANTKSTSDGISTLSTKTDSLVKSTNVNDNKKTGDTKVSINSKPTYNSNPIVGAMNNQPSTKDKKDYSVAKTIAAGRF